MSDFVGYAGDVSPEAAWTALKSDGDARLIDVRTTAEWAYVGLPDLGALGKAPVTVEWKQFPSMAVNPGFAGAVAAAGVEERRGAVFPVPVGRAVARCGAGDVRAGLWTLLQCRHRFRGRPGRSGPSGNRRRLEDRGTALAAGLTKGLGTRLAGAAPKRNGADPASAAAGARGWNEDVRDGT